ncbi:hypothetical protein ACFL43_05670 [Thermodesulfobacteriota bacterium]
MLVIFKRLPAIKSVIVLDSQELFEMDLAGLLYIRSPAKLKKTAAFMRFSKRWVRTAHQKSILKFVVSLVIQETVTV